MFGRDQSREFPVAAARIQDHRAAMGADDRIEMRELCPAMGGDRTAIWKFLMFAHDCTEVAVNRGLIARDNA